MSKKKIEILLMLIALYLAGFAQGFFAFMSLMNK